MKKVVIVTLLIALFGLASCHLSDKSEREDAVMIDDKMEDSMVDSDHSGEGMMEEDSIEMKKEEVMMKKSTFTMNDSISKEILVDEKGMTLYVFKKDVKNTSNCAGECEVKWPVYFNENLNENGFSSIKRSDEKMQTTYNGYPLYYFFKDTKAGDINGHKVKDVWFAVDKEVSFLNSMMDDKMEESEAMMKKEGFYADYTEKALAEAKGNRVLFFHATWCPSCVSADKKMKTEEIPEGLNVFKVDYDSNIDLRKKYEVTSQHTFIQIDSEGNLLKKWVGGRSIQDVVENVK